MAAPMKQKLQIKFCIYCPESKLKETAKKRYCSSCHHKKKENDSNVKAFNIPKETTLENLDLELIKDMKYCLYCGEELIEDEGSLICIDGCGNLNITKDEMLQIKQKKEDQQLQRQKHSEVFVSKHDPEVELVTEKLKYISNNQHQPENQKLEENEDRVQKEQAAQPANSKLKVDETEKLSESNDADDAQNKSKQDDLLLESQKLEENDDGAQKEQAATSKVKVDKIEKSSKSNDAEDAQSKSKQDDLLPESQKLEENEDGAEKEQAATSKVKVDETEKLSQSNDAKDASKQDDLLPERQKLEENEDGVEKEQAATSKVKVDETEKLSKSNDAEDAQSKSKQDDLLPESQKLEENDDGAQKEQAATSKIKVDKIEKSSESNDAEDAQSKSKQDDLLPESQKLEENEDEAEKEQAATSKVKVAETEKLSESNDAEDASKQDDLLPERQKLEENEDGVEKEQVVTSKVKVDETEKLSESNDAEDASKQDDLLPESQKLEGNEDGAENERAATSKVKVNETEKSSESNDAEDAQSKSKQDDLLPESQKLEGNEDGAEKEQAATSVKVDETEEFSESNADEDPQNKSNQDDEPFRSKIGENLERDEFSEIPKSLVKQNEREDLKQHGSMQKIELAESVSFTEVCTDKHDIEEGSSSKCDPLEVKIAENEQQQDEDDSEAQQKQLANNEDEEEGKDKKNNTCKQDQVEDDEPFEMVEFEEGKSATATFIKVDKDLEISSTDDKEPREDDKVQNETKNQELGKTAQQQSEDKGQNENTPTAKSEQEVEEKQSLESPGEKKNSTLEIKENKEMIQHSSLEVAETSFTEVMEEQKHLHGSNPVYKNPPTIEELNKYANVLEKKYKELGDVLQVNKKKSFNSVIEKWQKQQKVPYTWDTFLFALRAIGEDKIADDIKGMLEHPEEYPITTTRINAQQEEICLLVAMDLTVWGFESDVEFKLTFISKEINDWGTFSLPFQCILQLGNHRLYRYKIYIPSTYMWNAQYLRYKYVVFRANDNQQIEEKLDYNCRIFRKDTHIQYDAEIKPNISYLKSLITRQPSIPETFTNALCLYIDWAITEGWMSVNSDTAGADINKNAKRIKQVVINLSHPLCFQGKFFKDVKRFEDLSVVTSVFKMLLTKLLSYLSSLTGLKKFLGALTVLDILYCLKCHSEKKYTVTDVDFYKKLAASLCLPVDELSESVLILSKFSTEFRSDTILPVATNLCQSIILQNGYEWIGVLPLIHVIKLKDFTSFGESYRLTKNNTAQEIHDFIYVFCGLKVKTFNTNEARLAMDVIRPYFKADWLMPRAFALLCPYKDIIRCTRDFPEMAPLICWKVGHICLDKITFSKIDEIEDLTRGLNCLITPLRELVCSKEEKTLCHKGACHVKNGPPHKWFRGTILEHKFLDPLKI